MIVPKTYTKQFEYACVPAPRPRIMQGHAVRDEAYQGWKQRVADDWYRTHGFECLEAFDTYTVTIRLWAPMRGDLDNYAKSVLDGLTGAAFKGDSVVVLRHLDITWVGRGKRFIVGVSGVKDGSGEKDG